MNKQWLFGLLFLATNAFSQAMITKVIELNYLSADKAIQLIQPLLPNGEQLSGSGSTLIVKVSPETLTQIRGILHKIDVAPVTFNIAIYQGDPNWLNSQNNNSVSNGTRPQSEQWRSQSVKVMSGGEAYISTGQEVPIVTAVSGGYGGEVPVTNTGGTPGANQGANRGGNFGSGGNPNTNPALYNLNPGISYEQHQIKNGFMVSPVLKGSQVKLSVKRVREQQNAAGGQQFDNQQLDTIMMVPLNKWVSLGSAEGAQFADPTSTSSSAGRPFSQNSTLYIKVSINGASPASKKKPADVDVW